jgi:hypothetical protein
MNLAPHPAPAVNRPTPLHLVPFLARRARPAPLRPQHILAAALLSLVGMGMTAPAQEEAREVTNVALRC